MMTTPAKGRVVAAVTGKDESSFIEASSSLLGMRECHGVAFVAVAGEFSCRFSQCFAPPRLVLPLPWVPMPPPLSSGLLHQHWCLKEPQFQASIQSPSIGATIGGEPCRRCC
ncbi:hypothetical protein PIB30_032433 [Stylosanthes scabra]|uniref:Uncharacterized protein n=1 Tax=Stylosanthes scabra TaxID=79078 RepID=A0ABU6ZCJ2_9FABA|nr:hypothetical protein [Stylosanthes scabra]